MKRFAILTPILMLMLILSACGARAVPQTTPTISAVELQATIAMAAFTSIAQTQAALPTATLLPTATITDTPAPTATFIPLSTLEAAQTLTSIPAGTSAAADPCINKVLPESLVGEKIKIRIDNPTKAALMVSVYLLQAGPQSECGYRGYSLAPQESLVINDLVEGCYTIWAWNPDPKDYFIVTNGTSCLDTSNTWTFDISTSSIKLRN